MVRHSGIRRDLTSFGSSSSGTSSGCLGPGPATAEVCLLRGSQPPGPCRREPTAVGTLLNFRVLLVAGSNGPRMARCSISERVSSSLPTFFVQSCNLSQPATLYMCIIEAKQPITLYFENAIMIQNMIFAAAANFGAKSDRNAALFYIHDESITFPSTPGFLLVIERNKAV
jgi:hypothetical protein